MINVSKYSNEIIRNKDTLWIKINNNELCKMIYSFNFAIIKAKFISYNTIVFNILAPNIYEIKKFENNLKNNCIIFEIINIKYNENFELTDYQKEILIKLYEYGYFDDERKTTLTESSELLNVSASSLSETLRRTIKKIIEYYINDKL